ncbi:unnamed protein product [Prunus armeniaca]
MFQNLHCRLAHVARRSGQGPWSAGDALGGRARRSTYETAGLECRTVRGTPESPTSDLTMLLEGVWVPSAGHSPSLDNMSPASSRESNPTSPSGSETQHPVEDPQTRSESREKLGGGLLKNQLAHLHHRRLFNVT